MSVSETPRTWTLNFQNGMFFPLADEKARNDRIEVIEKAPVDAERERILDLLERLLSDDASTAYSAGGEAEALLRKHGRLSEHLSIQERE